MPTHGRPNFVPRISLRCRLNPDCRTPEPSIPTLSLARLPRTAASSQGAATQTGGGGIPHFISVQFIDGLPPLGGDSTVPLPTVPGACGGLTGRLHVSASDPTVPSRPSERGCSQSYSIYLLPSRPLGRSHWDVSPTDSGDRCCCRRRHRPRPRSCPAWCRRHRWQRLLALLPLRFFFSPFGRKAAVHWRPGQMVLWGHVRQGVPEEEGRMDSGVGNPACNPPSIGSQSSPHRSLQSLKREWREGVWTWSEGLCRYGFRRRK